MAKLVLQNVEKYFNQYCAVDNVSLSVEDGEFVVLVGPSGCGKSTLLRTIAGLEDISAGKIFLGGRRIDDEAPRSRNISMVFQSYALYPFLSVYENVAFGLRARNATENVISDKVSWAAELLGIGSYLDRLPRELSGGQRQRVAIGRAIVRDADLYLFDEPLSNLDAKLRDGMREEIKRLHKQLGKTFVYVTHDQVEAMTLADRIVLMRDAKIVQVGPPLELFERPSNLFVAGFLGSPQINVIPVTLNGNELKLPSGQVLKVTRKGFLADELPNGDYHWGIRPEHFALAPAGEGMIKASIDVVQPTGSRTYGSFALGGVNVIAEFDAHALNAIGSSVELIVAIERTTLFDRDSEAALSAGCLEIENTMCDANRVTSDKQARSGE